MMMPIIRPVRMNDFEAIHELAKKSGGGMTNLPADRDTLMGRIEKAVHSFDANAQEPGPEVYLMVLEVDGDVLGTAAVFSSIGLEFGFVNYKLNWVFHASEQLGKQKKHCLLVPTHDFTGASEVGSLFLSDTLRGTGFGKMLARSRYLFMAQKPEIFAEPVCAELRGWRAPDGEQPFWDALGRHFFDMDFEEADIHNSAAGNQFIADLMPRSAIYEGLLPQSARACIGKPHDAARPALELLEREGFTYNGYVDIFDGGPLVSARSRDIATIRDSRLLRVKIGTPKETETGLLAAGAVADFRATRDFADLGGENEDQVIISQSTADLLRVENDQEIRWVAW